MKRLFLILMLVVMSGLAYAQNLSACPGLKNPTSFVVGTVSNPDMLNSVNPACYTGQLGTKPYAEPNPITGVTGMTFTGNILTGANLASQISTQSTSYCGTTINSETRFRIMSNTDGPGTGANLGKDPCANFTINYVPSNLDPTFTKSIRIGNCRISREAEALYYNMYVTPDNALLDMYFAMVVQAPGHDTDGDPTFIIRVTKKNAAGQYVQISDTLCYMVSSTPVADGGTVVIGEDGWTSIGSGYSAIFVRDWRKVSICLNDYLYETVRVEMLISDCAASGHYGYCYVAGNCQPMKLQSSGCPLGRSTVVDSLRAPDGMSGYGSGANRLPAYKWYKCTTGQVDNILNIGPNVNFVQTGYADTNQVYCVTTNDFRITEGPDLNTMASGQTFRCDMVSCMDPTKPITSRIYVNIDNAKPVVAIDQIPACDGSISLTNTGYSASETIDTTRTKWYFYEDAACATGVLDSIVGSDNVSYTYDESGPHGVALRIYTETLDNGLDCYTEQTFPITTVKSPDPGFTIDNDEPCLNALVLFTDTTLNSSWRKWTFPDDEVVLNGTEELTYTRAFYYTPVPVSMEVRNGEYYLNPLNIRDTIWCSAIAEDTINVFTSPDLLVSPDTIVCMGSRTNVTVTASIDGETLDSCEYFWYRHYNQTGEQHLQTGNVLEQFPDADNPTTTFYVKVVSPQGCEAWDSVTVYIVDPVIDLDVAEICPGETATLIGSNAFSYTWSASPDDNTLLGQENNDTIRVSPTVTTTYTLVGHGSDGCSANPLTKTVTVLPFPEPAVEMNPDFVDSENPVVTFQDVSPNSTSSFWDFHNGDTYTTRTVEYVFTNLKADSVPVSLTTANRLGCQATLDFWVPVQLFTVWFPNAFLPNSDYSDVNVFRVHSTNQLEYFRIYIYDRRGQLVFSSQDQNFEWDGIINDRPAPQGTYVYVCKYRRPGTPDIITQKGSISLIR